MEDDTSFRGALLEWARSEALAARSIAALLDSFCRFLNSHDLDIRRCSLGTETVHPLLTNTRHAWFNQVADPGKINPGGIVSRHQYLFGAAMIDEILFATSGPNNAALAASPFSLLAQNREVHAPILPAGEPQRYPVFDDLAVLGCTDYYCTTLPSFAGKVQRIGIATGLSGGFGSTAIDRLRDGMTVLAMPLNTLVEYNLKETLARVYVGRDPGSRVCAGMIRPGQVVSLDAAIWFSDIRGFTETSEGLEPQALVERLNAYFEVIAAAIYGAGGEILKYIGDAVLAVFPVENSDAKAACVAALAALHDARARLAILNEEFAARAELPVAHGVGLHLGTASYGNIGGRERLDFTVIGRAVNLASRIESMCKTLDADALCSGDFAAAADLGGAPLGEFELKGVSGTVAIHRIG